MYIQIYKYLGTISIFFGITRSHLFFSPPCLFELPVRSHFKFGTVCEAAATAKKFVEASVWVMLS